MVVEEYTSVLETHIPPTLKAAPPSKVGKGDVGVILHGGKLQKRSSPVKQVQLKTNG